MSNIYPIRLIGLLTHSGLSATLAALALTLLAVKMKALTASKIV